MVDQNLFGIPRKMCIGVFKFFLRSSYQVMSTKKVCTMFIFEAIFVISTLSELLIRNS